MFVCVHMEPKVKVKEKNRGHFKGFLSSGESAAVGIFRIGRKTRVLGDQLGPALDLNCNTALLPPLCLVRVQHGNVVNDHGKLQWKSTTRPTTHMYSTLYLPARYTQYPYVPARGSYTQLSPTLYGTLLRRTFIPSACGKVPPI